MNKDNFWVFLKWYFNYTTREFFNNSNTNTPSYVGSRERLPAIIISYLFFLGSFVILFIPVHGIHWFTIFGIVISVGFLLICRFSIIYYICIYKKYINKDLSMNEKIIFEECILYKLNKNFRRLISNYYRIVDVKGNFISVKFYLQERKNKSDNILKISTNKIIFNGEKIFDEIHDTSDLIQFFEKYKKS